MNQNDTREPGFRVFAHLTVLRSLRKDPVLRELRRAEKHPEHEHHLARAREAMLEQAEGLGLSGDLWKGYFLHLLAEGNNLAGEVVEEQGQVGSGIQAALVRDLEQVQPFFNLTASQVFGDRLYENYRPSRVRKALVEDRLGKQLAAATGAAQQAELLLQHYQRYGRGELARYEAFCLDRKGRFLGIPGLPPLRLGRHPGVRGPEGTAAG